MRKILLLFVCLSLIGFNVYAKNSKEYNENELSVMQDQLNKMRGQDLVVRVLAGQYNKEVAELRRMQAVFCDVFKLDLEMWRQGRYEWNDDKKRFDEREAPKREEAKVSSIDDILAEAEDDVFDEGEEKKGKKKRGLW